MKTEIKKDENFEYVKLVEAPLYQKFFFEPTQISTPGSNGTSNSWKSHKSIVEELEEPRTKFKNFCIDCDEERIFTLSDTH